MYSVQLLPTLFSLYVVMRQWVHVAHFILWRFTWFCLHKLNRARAPKDRLAVERHCILGRLKVNGFDYNKGHDFITWLTGSVDVEELTRRDTHWTLYSTDVDYVYFVRMPKPIAQYTADTTPFLWMVNMKQALEVAVMTTDAWCEHASQLESNPSKVIFFTSCARSGTTLLARMLCMDGKATAFSEPDVFSVLSNHAEQKSIPEKRIAQLADAAIRFHRVPLESEELLTLKIKPNIGIYLVPILHKFLPQYRQMFMHRRDVTAGWKSNEKVLSYGSRQTIAEQPVGDAMLYIMKACRLGVFAWKRAAGIFHQRYYQLLLPDNHQELAWIWYGATYALYKQSKHAFTYTCIFENLVSSKNLTDNLLPRVNQAKDGAGELARVLAAFDVDIDPATLTDRANFVMQQDSQRGTSLSQAAFAGLPTAPMTDDRKSQSRKYARAMGLPADFFIKGDPEVV